MMYKVPATRSGVDGHYLINLVWKDEYPDSITFVAAENESIDIDDEQLAEVPFYRQVLKNISDAIDEEPAPADDYQQKGLWNR